MSITRRQALMVSLAAIAVSGEAAAEPACAGCLSYDLFWRLTGKAYFRPGLADLTYQPFCRVCDAEMGNEVLIDVPATLDLSQMPYEIVSAFHLIRREASDPVGSPDYAARELARLMVAHGYSEQDAAILASRAVAIQNRKAAWSGSYHRVTEAL